MIKGPGQSIKTRDGSITMIVSKFLVPTRKEPPKAQATFGQSTIRTEKSRKTLHQTAKMTVHRTSTQVKKKVMDRHTRERTSRRHGIIITRSVMILRLFLAIARTARTRTMTLTILVSCAPSRKVTFRSGTAPICREGCIFER